MLGYEKTTETPNKECKCKCNGILFYNVKEENVDSCVKSSTVVKVKWANWGIIISKIYCAKKGSLKTKNTQMYKYYHIGKVSGVYFINQLVECGRSDSFFLVTG